MQPRGCSFRWLTPEDTLYLRSFVLDLPPTPYKKVLMICGYADGTWPNPNKDTYPQSLRFIPNGVWMLGLNPDNRRKNQGLLDCLLGISRNKLLLPNTPTSEMLMPFMHKVSQRKVEGIISGWIWFNHPISKPNILLVISFREWIWSESPWPWLVNLRSLALHQTRTSERRDSQGVLTRSIG